MITEHQDHMPSPGDSSETKNVSLPSVEAFDYCRVENIFKRLILLTQENDGELPTTQGLITILDAKLIKAYFEWCLSNLYMVSRKAWKI